MASDAAKTVKFGFLVAAGFWLFAIVLIVFLMLALRAVGSK